MWVLIGVIVIGLYLIVDSFLYRKEAVALKAMDAIDYEPISLQGTLNLVFLAAIVASVAFAAPSSYREVIMWTMAACSLLYSKNSEVAKEARAHNHFSFSPIIEVGVIFAEIFATMMPALALLNTRGSELGVVSPEQYYWATGIFSAFLDNAPTFLCFLELGMSTQGVHHASEMMTAAPDILAGISLGAVFFGAMTYIGNAPNFMVRSIAVHQKVKMPSFLGYMLWSIPILIPVFYLVAVLMKYIQ